MMKKLLFIVLGLTSLNVYAADPTYDVTKGALQNNSALCGYGYNPNCPSEGGNATSSSKIIIYHDVVVPDKFGALAYSEKAGHGHIAGAVNQDSLDAAKREAVKNCQQGSQGAPCKVTKWIRNGCLAVSKGKLKDRLLITQVGGALGTVEQKALADCRAKGATECEISIPEACSLP